MKNKLIEELKQAVANSDLEECFRLLKDNIQEFTRINSKLITLESRYSFYKQELIEGVIAKEDQILVRNQIQKSLLDLIQEIEKDQAELEGLYSVKNSLNLKLVDKEKKKIFYKRFRTGDVFDFEVSLDMRARTLKDMLVEKIIPEYRNSTYLRSEIGFQLCLLKYRAALDDSASLTENGVEEGDTVYLKRYFIYDEDER